MSEPVHYAPGQPGLPPRWTSSAKSGVGTSLNMQSRIWFTISSGILNEVYYPSVDRACLRDMEFLVTDGKAFFSEEQADTETEISTVAVGVPAFRLVNTCKQRRYRIEKEILADPSRDVVLQRVRFVPLQGSLSDYRLYALVSPHLSNRGADNTGFVGDYKGIPMLFAEREGDAVAIGCSLPWMKLSVGFVGFSDGWQDIHEHKQMEWSYTRAENGNIALTAEVDLSRCNGEFVVALGFGRLASEAGYRVRSSLTAKFETARKQYVKEWQDWQKNLPLLAELSPQGSQLPALSSAVIRIHEAKRFPGGLIASLSIPWGFSKGDDDLGGYHLVWPRDLVESGGALLAMGAKEDVGRILRYLNSTQEADGYWPQNMWIDGTRYWGGIQMDETALPILLVEMARREEALGPEDLSQLWPMVKKAAGFIARNGPVTQQDRWEEDPGYSPFTLSAEIASLLVAADLAEANNESELAQYLRETADYWNASIERWTFVKDTELAGKFGVNGYYVRVAPGDEADAASPAKGYVPIKHRASNRPSSSNSQVISLDPLALVRFGLRMPDDPRVADTIKVVDGLLKVDTPQGPLWRRYGNDKYGEYDDGRPFDGSGRGRLWPLLTGERAHYELAAGRRTEAEHLLQTLTRCGSGAGLIPEQVWDAPDIPGRKLFFGRPTGAAMPLVWAHAEYLKLLRSLRDNRIFDLPPQTVRRYLRDKTDTSFSEWRKNHKTRTMFQGKTLRFGLPEPAIVHWSSDNWKSITDTSTRDTGIGIWVADLPTGHLPADTSIDFTFYWHASQRWEGQDFQIKIIPTNN